MSDIRVKCSNDRKLSAIGVKIRRWVTLHGTSVNIEPDMMYFRNIIPCGIKDRAVGSIKEIDPTVTFKEMTEGLIKSFSDVFQVEYASVYHNEAAMRYLDGIASNKQQQEQEQQQQI